MEPGVSLLWRPGSYLTSFLPLLAPQFRTAPGDHLGIRKRLLLSNREGRAAASPSSRSLGYKVPVKALDLMGCCISHETSMIRFLSLSSYPRSSWRNSTPVPPSVASPTSAVTETILLGLTARGSAQSAFPPRASPWSRCANPAGVHRHLFLKHSQEPQPLHLSRGTRVDGLVFFFFSLKKIGTFQRYYPIHDQYSNGSNLDKQ